MSVSSGDDVVDRTLQPLPDSPACGGWRKQNEQGQGDADRARDNGSPSSSRSDSEELGDPRIMFVKLMPQNKRQRGGDAEDSDQARYTGSSSLSTDEHKQQQPHIHGGGNGKVSL